MHIIYVHHTCRCIFIGTWTGIVRPLYRCRMSSVQFSRGCKASDPRLTRNRSRVTYTTIRRVRKDEKREIPADLEECGEDEGGTGEKRGVVDTRFHPSQNRSVVTNWFCWFLIGSTRQRNVSRWSVGSRIRGPVVPLPRHVMVVGFGARVANWREITFRINMDVVIWRGCVAHVRPLMASNTH